MKKNLIALVSMCAIAGAAYALTPQETDEDYATLEWNLATCESIAGKPPFLGSELVLCSAERTALVAVLEPAYLACRTAASRSPFVGAEVVTCGRERAALVRVKYLGNQAALPL